MGQEQTDDFPFDLTVIIPTIGRGSLANAVDSIVEPDLKVQILVITDKIENVSGVDAMLAGRRVQIIKGPNLGAPGARNEGIRLSSGRYIAFLDDDDLWLPLKATKQIREIEKTGDTENALCVVGVKFLAKNGKLRETPKENFQPKKESLANFIVGRKKLLFRGSQFCTVSILISSSFSERVKFNEATSIHDDWDFIIRLANLPGARVVQLHEKLVHVNQGSPNSISASRNWSKSLEFLDRHSSDIYGRSRFDFVLCNILLPALISSSREGVRESIRRLPVAFPHLGGLARFIAGVFLKR